VTPISSLTAVVAEHLEWSIGDKGLSAFFAFLGHVAIPSNS
jgi:hypothetical protein